jgi:hypothetical protein
MAKIYSFDGNMGTYFSSACGEDWPGWQKFNVFYGNMELILVLHAEKISLDGKIKSFRWQYGTYSSFA